MANPNFQPPEPAELSVSINGVDRILTWYNASLWTHAEYYREYDHIFFQTEEDEDTNEGLYIFRGIDTTRAPFIRLAGFMIAQDFNRQHKAVPSDVDRRNFDITKKNLEQSLAERAIAEFQKELENIDLSELE